MAKGLLKNTVTVGAFTMLSRVLGLVREMFQSRLIGAGMEQSAFTLAFAIPNMARKLFGEGALTAAFVPVFKGVAEAESLERAALLARRVMTMVLLMLGAVVASLMVVSSPAARAGSQFDSPPAAAGSRFDSPAARAGSQFDGLENCQTSEAEGRACQTVKPVSEANESNQGDGPARLALTLGLVRTLLPYMIFICGAAFGMGVLNSLGRFKASSFMPCLLNICWIGVLAGLSFFPDMRLERRVHCVAWAILAAGAAQMAFLFWRMRVAGVTPRPVFTGWGDAKVRLVWRNLGVAALGAGAVQLNYLLDQLLAYCASPWAAGVIGYAERLMDLPLGIVGVAFGTVLLPTFAGLFAKNDADGAREAMAASVKSLMFVMLPAAAGLFVLAPEITAVIYEGGGFDATATVRVARALAVYALGLGSFGLMKSLVPWFQAQNDMKTPLRVSVGTVVLNATLNILAVFLLGEEWRHVGLAASTVVCSAVGCAALIALGVRRNGSLGLAACVPQIARIAAASVAMGVVVWFLRGPTGRLVAQVVAPSGATGRVATLALLIACGGAVYLVAAALLMPGQLCVALRRVSRRKVREK